MPWYGIYCFELFTELFCSWHEDTLVARIFQTTHRKHCLMTFWMTMNIWQFLHPPLSLEFRECFSSLCYTLMSALSAFTKTSFFEAFEPLSWSIGDINLFVSTCYYSMCVGESLYWKGVISVEMRLFPSVFLAAVPHDKVMSGLQTRNVLSF